MYLRCPLESSLSVNLLLYLFGYLFGKLVILLCGYLIGAYLLIGIDDHPSGLHEHGCSSCLLLCLLLLDPFLELVLIDNGDLAAVGGLHKDLGGEGALVL